MTQGFGKTGSYAAQFLEEQGAKIIGVASSETATYNEVRPPPSSTHHPPFILSPCTYARQSHSAQ
jgi:hypothetical protein